MILVSMQILKEQTSRVIYVMCQAVHFSMIKSLIIKMMTSQDFIFEIEARMWYWKYNKQAQDLEFEGRLAPRCIKLITISSYL